MAIRTFHVVFRYLNAVMGGNVWLEFVQTENRAAQHLNNKVPHISYSSEKSSV